MKTINLILLISFTLIANTIFAQIKIQSNGNVSIGTTTDNGSQMYLYGYNQGTLYSNGYYTATYGNNIHARVEGSSATNRNSTRCFIVDNSGSFNFYVYGDGTAYTKGVLITSDSTEKNDIQEIENALEKVMKLRGVTFNFNDSSKTGKSNSYKSSSTDIKPEILDIISKESNRKEMGVIAQEVESVVPEVVRTVESGKKAVAYNELIGLLIEAIKEQQMQIEELKSIVSNESSSYTSALENKNITNQCILKQNSPNPFNQNTKIEYYIPEKVLSATLKIYDYNGRQLKSYDLYNKGTNNIVLGSTEFQPGIYLYSLIADNVLIDTKQMVLTE